MGAVDRALHAAFQQEASDRRDGTLRALSAWGVAPVPFEAVDEAWLDRLFADVQEVDEVLCVVDPPARLPRAPEGTGLEPLVLRSLDAAEEVGDDGGEDLWTRVAAGGDWERPDPIDWDGLMCSDEGERGEGDQAASERESGRRWADESRATESQRGLSDEDGRSPRTVLASEEALQDLVALRVLESALAVRVVERSLPPPLHFVLNSRTAMAWLGTKDLEVRPRRVSGMRVNCGPFGKGCR